MALSHIVAGYMMSLVRKFFGIGALSFFSMNVLAGPSMTLALCPAIGIIAPDLIESLELQLESLDTLVLRDCPHWVRLKLMSSRCPYIPAATIASLSRQLHVNILLVAVLEYVEHGVRASVMAYDSDGYPRFVEEAMHSNNRINADLITHLKSAIINWPKRKVMSDILTSSSKGSLGSSKVIDDKWDKTVFSSTKPNVIPTHLYDRARILRPGTQKRLLR